MLNRISTLLFLTLCVVSTPALAQQDRPNILIILADDLGYRDLGVQGCKQFETPHIDSIAHNGIRFTEGYVSNSVCAPSRAGLMTGRIGIGFESNIPYGTPHGLDPNVKTLATVLQQADYKTYCIGKWHLGERKPFHPNQRGFDEFYGLTGGSRTYFPKKNLPLYQAIQRNGVVEAEPEGSYLTDRFTEAAIDYLKGHDKTKPFLMYLSHTAPHTPMEPKAGYAERFGHIPNERRRRYAGLVASLDEGVGAVLETLKAEEMYDNTLIVFLSDNGGPTNANSSSNLPLRGQKGQLTEGGIRVPFLIQWPKAIEKGQVIDLPVSSLDLAPTFFAMAGIEADQTPKTDGLDLLPLMTRGETEGLADRPLLWRRGKKTNIAYRMGDYKWMLNRRRGKEELYDLSADIGEKNNLLQAKPEVAAKLAELFKQWEATAPDPAFDSGWKPKKK